MTLYDFSASYITSPFVMPPVYSPPFQTSLFSMPSFSSYPSIFGGYMQSPAAETYSYNPFSFMPAIPSYGFGSDSTSSFGLFSYPRYTAPRTFSLFGGPSSSALDFGSLTGSSSTKTNPYRSTYGGFDILASTRALSSSITSSMSMSMPTLTTTSTRKSTGKKPTVSRALQLAQAEVGTSEVNGSNDSAGIRKYKNGAGNNLPWCASFISWIFGAGQGSDNNKTFGYSMKSQTIRRRAQKAGFYATKNSGYKPKPGDLMVLKYSDDSGHIGIVSKVNADGTFETIEGNSSNKVRRVQRSMSTANLHGFIKMDDWLQSA